MLRSRLEGNQKAIARASHAVRKLTTEQEWPEIDSTMVDDITSQPLPPPQTQLQNLIGWLKRLAGDSHFEPIEIEDYDALAGVVGAVDADALEPVLKWGFSQDLILPAHGETAVQLTPKAWESPSPDKSKPVEPKMSPEEPKKCKGHCPECGPNRNADIVASFEKRWEPDDVPIWTIDTYRILRCGGCETIYIQHKHFFSEDEEYYTDHNTGEFYSHIEPRVTYWPAPARRNRPDWFDEIRDEILRNILDEVYGALDSDHRILAAIGTRTAIDRAMVLLGADESLAFAEKISRIQEDGIISRRDRPKSLTL